MDMSNHTYKLLNNNCNNNNTLELLKQKESVCEKIYERAYQIFLNKLLNDSTREIKNIAPIKLTRSVNIIK